MQRPGVRLLVGTRAAAGVGGWKARVCPGVSTQVAVPGLRALRVPPPRSPYRLRPSVLILRAALSPQYLIHALTSCFSASLKLLENRGLACFAHGCVLGTCHTRGCSGC